MRAAVLVLGDLGRSPRMQHHALALAAQHVDVDLIGLAGAEPWPEVRRNRRIVCHILPRRSGPALLRVAWDGARALIMLLFVVRAPDVILVQNPPAIPILPIGWMAARLRSTRLVIDWHNLGYSMVALRFGRPRLTRVARWVEGSVGRRADAHVCVSNALRAALKSEWDIDAVTLHDRPVEEIHHADRMSRQTSRTHLADILGRSLGSDTVVVISPTSWSLDEDFDLLVDAIDRCRDLLRDGDAHGRRYRNIVLAITGVGPRRGAYEPRLAEASSDRLFAHAIWLEANDYHHVLAAADVGLCVHRSASGLDLPMKIADMFGAGVPVLALDYGPVLEEVLRDGDNSRLFTDRDGLARALCELAEDSAPAQAQRDRLRNGVEAMPIVWWEDLWTARARSVLLPS